MYCTNKKAIDSRWLQLIRLKMILIGNLPYHYQGYSKQKQS